MAAVAQSVADATTETAGDLAGLPRIWAAAAGTGKEDGPEVVLFRRCFHLDSTDALACARLRLFAESSYLLWVNGEIVDRGPTFFHPHRRPVRELDLGDFLQEGKNVLALLVQSLGVPLHNHIPSACPGLVCRLDLTTSRRQWSLCSDASWKTTRQSGWLRPVPRRSWAIGHVEHFDAEQAPKDWQNLDFNDTHWEQAKEFSPIPAIEPAIEWITPKLPPLRFVPIPAQRLPGLWHTAGEKPTLEKIAPADTATYARMLMNEAWTPVDDPAYVNPNSADTLVLDRLQPDHHLALIFDLGAQYTGHPMISVISDSGGVIDFGWSELLENGRPQLLRKGNSYANQLRVRTGATDWIAANFSAGRFITLVLRGFQGRLELKIVGMLSSEPDLAWQGRFESENAQLNRIWQLCARTLRVGAQEGLMDCPTREQAPYVGDGNPNACWIARQTGDDSYWRHLIQETFAVQSEDGLVKSTPFSGCVNVLLDYNLLAVIWLPEYLNETGDLSLIRDVLPGARRMIQWFIRHENTAGLFAYDWELREQEGLLKTNSGEPYAAHAWWVDVPERATKTIQTPSLNVFIDHPGMGWHNVGEPGIDRRGLNAAMNALYALSLRALAELEDRCGGDGNPWRQRARRIAEAATCFWNEQEGAFVDGIRQGQQLPQISQQTNTWCVAAGFCPGKEQAVLQRILRADDQKIARNGPYFWLYTLPLLLKFGLARPALTQIEQLWAGMLEAGATTAWETFAGDDLDSFCHPWSGVPADFLIRHIAGIGSLPATAKTIQLQPRPDLLNQVTAKAVLPGGTVTISWEKTGKGFRFAGKCPKGITGTLTLPSGWTCNVTGSWEQVCPADMVLS